MINIKTTTLELLRIIMESKTNLQSTFKIEAEDPMFQTTAKQQNVDATKSCSSDISDSSFCLGQFVEVKTEPEECSLDSSLLAKTENNEYCDIDAGEFEYPCEINSSLTEVDPQIFKSQVSNKRKKSLSREKKFKCNDCGNRFSRKTNLAIHVRIHTGEKPFKCTVCEKAFSLKNNLDRHMVIHSKEKPFKCTVCERAFSLKSNLCRHMGSHTGEKPFKCTDCGQTFSLKSSLTMHMKVKEMKKNEDRPFKCKVCDRSFSVKKYLKGHMRTHSGEKPFQCSACGKVFSRKNVLKRHTMNHCKSYGEGPLQNKI